MIARRVRITGHVQGVFFRAWTREQADRLGVTGWVRNCADGSVEAHVEGGETAVEQMIALLRVGPPAALVEGVDSVETEPNGSEGFAVRH
ncbi:MAG TPA: acylphosphatase [Sphingomicrobium sp.]|nr:acylphosphatase [Sphingomicrobium sp.]